jgi:predicted AlkP superfamily phosphohydrolase/phosphomutase
MTGKPIIATGWSGHIDFLNPSMCTLLSGTIEQLDRSSVVKNVLLEQSKWFKPNDMEVGKAYKNIHKHYKKYLTPAKKLKHENKNKFSYKSMVDLLGNLLGKYVPKIKPQPKLSKLSLPKLKKV